jgi:hypothetical protein
LQPRRILYVIAIAIIAFLVFNHNDDQMQEDIIPNISREHIFDDFNNQTGEVWLSFPESFRGTNGELFYFGQLVSEKPVTKVYRIYSRESGQLYYRVHDEWDNVKLPANKFETYYLVQGEWIKDRK